MKISVVTVCYNAEDCVEVAVRSVLGQTYGGIEYIIVDGGSSDRTLPVIERYRSRIAKVISEPDEGIYDAMNKGIRNATGDVVYFLNADDELADPAVIHDIAEEFRKNPDVDIVVGHVVLTNAPQKKDHLTAGRRILYRKIDLLDKGICHQALFVKRRVFLSGLVFNPAYKVYADYDWVLSAFDRDLKIKIINRLIAKYNCQGFSFQNFSRYRRERAAIVFKHFSLLAALFYVLRYIVLRDLRVRWLRILSVRPEGGEERL